MNATYSLVRLGAATKLTLSGGGLFLLEENMIWPYDPI